VTVVLVARDLIVTSRIAATLALWGGVLLRIDSPAELPPPDDVRLLLVSWDERQPGWGESIAAWRDAGPKVGQSRVILFGSHRDVDGHRAAREHRISPVLARSALPGSLAKIVATLARDDALSGESVGREPR
jgi:hypothetical protein